MQQTLENPAIRQAERYGMPEPRIIGVCEGCGDDITANEDYFEDGYVDVLMHDDAVCVYKYYRKNVLIRR